jgi:AcrR family transcriptional regulator
MVDASDVRSRKREWMRAEILATAWDLVRSDGIAALSMRDLAAKVGMRAPSLYTYFPSKNDLYDAMYAEGMRQMDELVGRSPPGASPGETLRNRARAFVTAAVQDPFRFQLLFERPIPGFVPSPESLAIGLTRLDETRRMAVAAGLGGQRELDLLMATTRGLVAMQIANEPGGDRWVRLVDEAVDILVTHYGASGPNPVRRRHRADRAT